MKTSLLDGRVLHWYGRFAVLLSDKDQCFSPLQSIVSEEGDGATVAEIVEAIIHPTLAARGGPPKTLMIARGRVGAVVTVRNVLIPSVTVLGTNYSLSP